MNEDALPESGENFHVDLTDRSGAQFAADRRGTATITDDDTRADDHDRRRDGDARTTLKASFPVTLSGAAPTNGAGRLDDDRRIGDGAAATTRPRAAQLYDPAGQSSGTIKVEVNEDALPESTENFHVDMTSVSGALFTADRRGTATITDDDTEPTVTIGDVTVTEGHTGEVNANSR